MARSVADAVTLLGALTGIDSRDPATSRGDGKAYADYTRFLDPNGLRGVRLGVARSYFGPNEHVVALMEGCLEAMRDMGAETVDLVDDFPQLPGFLEDSELQVLLYEFTADLNAYLAGVDPALGIQSIADLIEFNERHRKQVMPYFGQEIFGMAVDRGPLTDQAYLDALEKNHRTTRTEGIDAVAEQHRLDAIVAPTAGPAWTTDLINGGGGSEGSSTPAAVAGYPSITVPAGYVFGLPIGVSFFGQAYTEPALIRIAYAFEQGTQVRQPPRYLPCAVL
jgi:amidase